MAFVALASDTAVVGRLAKIEEEVIVSPQICRQEPRLKEVPMQRRPHGSVLRELHTASREHGGHAVEGRLVGPRRR